MIPGSIPTPSRPERPSKSPRGRPELHSPSATGPGFNWDDGSASKRERPAPKADSLRGALTVEPFTPRLEDIDEPETMAERPKPPGLVLALGAGAGDEDEAFTPPHGSRDGAHDPDATPLLLSPREITSPRGGRPRRVSLSDLSQHTQSNACMRLHAQLRIPDSRARHRYDVVLMVLVLYTLAVVPLSSAFFASVTQPAAFVALDYALDAFFVLDIVLNFQTFYYLNSGDLVTSHRALVLSYAKSWLVFDLIAALATPIELCVEHDRTKRFVRLLRLLRVSRIARYEKTHYKYSALYRVAQLFSSFVFLCHCLSCLMFLGFYEGGEQKALGWGHDEIAHSDATGKYAISVYITLLMLIGEDTSPENTNQRIFTSIVLLLGACFYATIFGSVALLVKNFDAQKAMYNEKLDEVNTKMALMGLDEPTRARVQSYYAYIWKRLKSFNKEDQSFLAELPFRLRADITMALHKDMVCRVPFFHKCDEKFIADLVVRLRPQINMPGDTARPTPAPPPPGLC